MSEPSRPPGDDPQPQPPPPLDPDACCGEGCNPCVYDLHEQALERYRAELRAWQARQRPAGRPAAQD